MGHQGSKSSIEARVIFQRVGCADVLHRTDATVVRIQKKASSPPRCPQPAEKSAPHSWSHSRRHTEGLIYVMDNPTGGVWVNPREVCTRS